MTAYDEIQYTSRPFDETAPTNLAAIARLYGLKSPEIETSRVLELGCASGGNLIPHAITHPDGEYTGIDLSPVQINQGRELINRLNLQQVKLFAGSFESLPEECGQFDYIIAHGLYSWMPTELRPTLFRFLKDRLSETGVAYISYNTYPGWHMAAPLRDAMNFITRDFELESRPQVARQLLQSMLSATSGQQTAFAQMLLEEDKLLSTKQDHYLLYDHLNAENHPSYFEDFMSQAAAHQLAYVGDTELQYNLPDAFPQELLNQLEGEYDVIQREQIKDFFFNRRFRRTLLCHSRQSVSDQPYPGVLDELYFSCQLAVSGEVNNQTLADGIPVQFTNHENMAITLTHPLQKLLIHNLNLKGGASMTYQQITTELTQAGLPNNDPGVMEFLRNSVISLMMRGFIRISATAPAYNLKSPHKPQASPLARDQADWADLITNMRHQNVSLPPFERFFIHFLDGEREVSEIVSTMKAEGFSELPPGDPVLEFENYSEEQLLDICNNCLAGFRLAALII